MAIKEKSFVPRAFLLTLLLTTASFVAFSQTPTLVAEGGKVWVKNIEPEILYTFARYYNTQADWESVFPVRIQNGSATVTVAGKYEAFNESISFTPRYPFKSGTTYLAQFFFDEIAHNPNEVYLPRVNADALSLTFTTAESTGVLPELVAVYPKTNLIPENLLKFHFTFSKSMASGFAYSKIKLVKSNGEVVDKPFLIVDQELWDEEYKTLTILLDPGRIKRGLRPNLEMKPALQRSEQYFLVIDAGWRDIDNKHTNSRFVKQFTCVEADRTSPALKDFRVVSPAHENGSLIIDFAQSLDFIGLQNAVRVLDQSGNMVKGKLGIIGESIVEFVPKNSWTSSHFTLEFNPLLEDLAGNNLNRLFDEDLTLGKSVQSPQTKTQFIFSVPTR